MHQRGGALKMSRIVSSHLRSDPCEWVACKDGSQTRVCDTGPQVTPFSLFRGGSQRYSAIRTSCRGGDARDLRLRPPQPPPESPSCRAATRKPNASSCWPPAWSFLTSIRTSVSPVPPVPTAGGAGTRWIPGWLKATPWLLTGVTMFYCQRAAVA